MDYQITAWRGPRLRSIRVLMVLGWIAVIASCSRDPPPGSPVSPSALSSTVTARAPLSMRPMIDMCHATGTGRFVLISVSAAAEMAHRAHGDAAPGDLVPGGSNLSFGQDCAPVAPTLLAPASAFPGTPTGMSATEEPLTVSAEGTWSVGGSYGTFDADGAVDFATEPCALLTTAPMGALVGSVTGGATWFLIGKGPARVTTAGELLLAANDCPGPGGSFFLDNSGTLTITLTGGRAM